MNDMVPVNEVAKRGVRAAACIGGGIVLFVLGALPPIAGIIAGALAGAVGSAALASKDPSDKIPGLVTAAAGVLAVAANLPFIRAILRGPAKFILGAGALFLLGAGIWNLVSFLRGMKSRS
jgi:hypothetical protein